MNRSAWTGFFVTLFGFLFAWLYMIPLVFFIRWDSFKTGSGSPDDPSFIIRGDLPGWLRWAQTMDSRFPCGMYEPAMAEALGDGGYWRRLWASYLWCGHRNRAQGLAFMLGEETTDMIPNFNDPRADHSGWSETEKGRVFVRGNVTQVWVRTFWGWWIHGNEVYALKDGRFWSVPYFSGKKA